MGYNYSINWWKTKGYNAPPKHNPLDFLLKKIEWRYAKGIPQINSDCQAILGDSAFKLKNEEKKYSLLFTSPPYCSIVDYHVDQWLRLWLLKKGEDKPKTHQDKYCGRFNSKEQYTHLLENVFSSCAAVMNEKSTIYVRTDVREFTKNTTIQTLKKCFPEHEMEIVESNVVKNQTELFGNPSLKKEVDLILRKQ